MVTRQPQQPQSPATFERQVLLLTSPESYTADLGPRRKVTTGAARERGSAFSGAKGGT